MAYNPKTGKGLGRFYSAEHRAFRAWVKDNISEYAKHSRKADQMWLLETLTGVTA